MTDTSGTGNRPTDDAEERAPGDAQRVPVPHDQPLEGSSETFQAVDGVRVIHPPADRTEDEDDPEE